MSCERSACDTFGELRGLRVNGRRVGYRYICEVCAHPITATTEAGILEAHVDHALWMQRRASEAEREIPR